MEIKKLILDHSQYQQRCIVLGNQPYSNATQHQKRKGTVFSNSHLNRTNQSSFKNYNVGHAVKCFSGSNTRELNCYANPKLVDEQPNTLIAPVGSHNIDKFKHRKVEVENLIHRMIDSGKKCKSCIDNNTAISSIW